MQAKGHAARETAQRASTQATCCRCCRTAVLRKLGMIDGEGVVQIKGKAACEIDTADELLATELMLDGTFSGLDKHQLVALVSCLVPGEKSQVGPLSDPQI